MLPPYPHKKPAIQEPTTGRFPLFQKMAFFSSPRALALLISLFLLLATAAAFWQVRNNEFINLDDNLYVTENPYVQRGLTFKGIVWAFTTRPVGHWHPMTWLSHMLDAELYELNPGGHHVTNLLFHVANTLLLFLLLHKMTGALWASGFVAGLFSLHPLHVESVAWVAERKDVLFTFFWLLTLWAYLVFVKKPRLDRYLLVVLCYILSLLSKPMAVTLPFVLLLLDYWPLGRLRSGPSIDSDHQRTSPLHLILEKVPLLLLTAIFCVFTFLSYQKVGVVTSFSKLPLEIRIGNTFVSYLEYIGKMIWPAQLAVLYPHPMVLPLWKILGSVMLVTVITVLILIGGRKRPYWIVGWLWYLGTLVPVTGLVQVGLQAMADRFTYVPLIGLFIIVAFGVSDLLVGWRYGKIVFLASGSAVLLIFMMLTMSQVALWQNSLRLFNHTLQVTANNSIIHNNLGVALMRQGKDDEAWAHYTKALEIDPSYADAQYNLGALLARQGKAREAMTQFVETLRIKPSHADAHHHLGVLLANQGRTEEAIRHYNEALRANPNFAEAYRNLGIALINQGKEQEAIPYFKEALEINPKDYIAHNNLGTAASRQGRIAEAMAHYRQALEINPASAETHYNLGSFLALQGKDEEALDHLNEALRIIPRDASVHYQIGAILARQGKNEEAILHLNEALQILPSYGEVHFALGMLYWKMGKKDLALERYRILQSINSPLANTLYRKISEADH